MQNTITTKNESNDKAKKASDLIASITASPSETKAIMQSIVKADKSENNKAGVSKPAIAAKPIKAIKADNASDTTKAAKAEKPAKAAKPAPLANADLIAKLNAHYNGALPTSRPVFGQPKQAPLNLTATNPRNPSERDYAFIRALRDCVNSEPFTQKQIACDSGNLARGIKLNLITITDKADEFGNPYYIVKPANAA
jgi:hypothetical protein